MNKFVHQTDQALKKKKKRWTIKGREVEDKYLFEIQDLFKDITLKRDELIEYLTYILELSDDKIPDIIGTYNDYAQTATMG